MTDLFSLAGAGSAVRVETGLDVIRREGLKAPGQGRVGLLCNQASVDRSLSGAPEILRSLPGIRLERIFSPQHGFFGEEQDNMVESGDGTHPGTGVPVISLYGRVREPEPGMLAGLDALVIDLPDVGTRVYTFLSTAVLCLKACARAKIPVIVLDRPNAIGGQAVEGPLLRSDLSSFVGLIPVPLRHGLTPGEYCRFAQNNLGLDVELEIIALRGWERGLYLDQTDVPWIAPSPNLPTLESAIVYTGMVLFEGTNLSEGRGTTRPFELWGAPWLDPAAVRADLERIGKSETRAGGGAKPGPAGAGPSQPESGRGGAKAGDTGVGAIAPRSDSETGDPPGYLLRELAYRPTFHKFAGEIVRGFQLHVTDRERFRPVLAAVTFLAAILRCHRDRFAWRQPPYEYETDRPPIDLIVGSDGVRRMLESGADPLEIGAAWAREERAFREIRKRALLYR